MAPWAGIAFAVLFGVAFTLLRQGPGLRASDAEFVAFYSGDKRLGPLVATLYLLPLSGVCFMWFAAALRYRLKLLEGSRLGLYSTVQFIAGIIFIVMVLIAGAGQGAAAAAVQFGSVQASDVLSTRQLIALSDVLLYIDASRIGAVFIVTSSAVGMRTKSMPRWLCLVGFASAALLFLASTFASVVVLVLPVWVGITSVILLMRRAHLI